MNARNDGPINGPPRRLRPPFQLALCLVFGLGLGMLFDRWILMAFVPSDTYADFRLIAEAWNTIDRYYVDRPAVNPQNLTYGAISGMVDALGDTGHSTFLTPDMVKELHVAEKGQLKGVGVEVRMNRKRQVVIVAPMDNSPAQRAGLRSGEIILSVDGKDIAGLSLSQVVPMISGPVGTKVELGMLDPAGHHLFTVTLTRATIKIPNVTWNILPGTKIADVRIAGFDDHMSADLISDLRDMRARGIEGMVLDLRNNPGGVLDQAVAVASQFLSGGNVLLVKDAQGTTTPIAVRPGGLATNMPMAVLINFGSASAAEIVAGALRDRQRAELIGETTFGTGTVLNEFPLTGGSALLLAVDEWLTPNGKSFWHKGIAPEIQVSLPSDTNPLFPAELEGMTAEQLKASDDKQLLRGLQWVEQELKQGRE